MSPIAFLLYNRPYVCFDAMPLSLETNVAFLGWPILLEEYKDKKECCITNNFKKYFVDYNDYSMLSRGKVKRLAKRTRIFNLVRNAADCSIVVIPRQKEGCVYLGRVKKFDLFNNPQWLNKIEYTSMPLIPGRGKKHMNGKKHPPAIEVAQGWNVEKWEKVPLALLPRWLQGKLHQQSVPCRLHGYDGIEDPYKIFDAMMSDSEVEYKRSFCQLDGVASDTEIRKRLLEGVGPTDFEFLVRDLMICERPELLWETGGKLADGGVDVAGFNKKTMEPEVLIQCKWQWDGEIIHMATPDKTIKKCLFVLLRFENEEKISRLENKGITYIGDADVVALVKSHAESVPFLRSIGIC